MSVEPLDFREWVDVLRRRIGDAKALNSDTSFKTLTADHADVTPDTWYHDAYDELVAQGHIDVPASGKTFGDAFAKLSADGRYQLRHEDDEFQKRRERLFSRSRLSSLLIFDQPAASIDWPTAEAFLNERVAESLNVDYKRELSDGVYRTIAAMANSYGGLILIGVDEDPTAPELPLLPAVGVDPADRERLVNQSYTRIQPPFAPDVIPVAVPNTSRVVLVVRVDPTRVERPVILSRGDSHRVFFRLETRNAEADRSRLAALFAEAGGAAAIMGSRAPSNYSPQPGGYHPLNDHEAKALIVRVAVEVQLPPGRAPIAVIDTASRDEFAEALCHSYLERWLTNYCASWGTFDVSDWRAQWRNTSWIATVGWQATSTGGEPLPVHGQGVVVLPMSMTATGRLGLLLDVLLQARLVGQTFPRGRLGLEDLYRLLQSLVVSAVEEIPAAVFATILGIPVWSVIGPVAYLHCGGGTSLGDFVDLSAYATADSDLTLTGAKFDVPRGVSLDVAEERDAVIRLWLTKLLLDMTLARFETDLANLA